MDVLETRSEISTRFLIISDTHGHNLSQRYCEHIADVAIHCGDLTNGSHLREFTSAIKLLQNIKAPLKLVIAGNHDFTLDIPVYQQKIREADLPLEWELFKREFGDLGEARSLFDKAKESGIIFLEEGTHQFSLTSGASMKVFASPYTPSYGDWGFQYSPDSGHAFNITIDVDVVITHGPPKGILDITEQGERAGCPKLFEAIARARPRMHCYGHIHEGWGAKLVTWRRKVSEKPSHLTDIDNGNSTVISRLSQLTAGTEIMQTSHCDKNPTPLKRGARTLFVNAAIEDKDKRPSHPAWLVDIDLPLAK
ncbi:Metallo-dependent phosphatase-like protein [Aspergillus heterothallicus]